MTAPLTATAILAGLADGTLPMDHLRAAPDGAVLIAALRTATDEHAREVLCNALMYRREPAAVDVLIECLTSPSSSVRSSAADGLATLRDPRAGEALFARLLAPEPHPGVYRMIIAALGAVQYHPAIPLLIPMLTSPDPGTRGTAAWSLGALRAHDALPALAAALAIEQTWYPRERMSVAIAELTAHR